MDFGFPALTTSARWVFMYGTAGYCFTRSGVMKIPLITTSHLLAPSAGRSPPNELKTNVDLTFQSFAIAFAMSTSKPTTLPELVFDSNGGKVGLSQYLNAPLTGAWTRWLAAAVPTTAKAARKASTGSGPTERFIAPPLLASILGRARRNEKFRP